MCTCSTEDVHMLTWSIHAIRNCIHATLYACTNHRNCSWNFLSLGKALHFSYTLKTLPKSENIALQFVRMHNWKCAHALLKVCTCSTEAYTCSNEIVHILYWRCEHAQLSMYTCSTAVSMLTVITCICSTVCTWTNHSNRCWNVLSFGKAWCGEDLAKVKIFTFQRNFGNEQSLASKECICSTKIVHMLN